MDTPTNAYQVPEDIIEVDRTLGSLLPDLTDTMMQETRDWRTELRAAIREWKGGAQEPDWQSYRDRMNDICMEDGMPRLFGPGTDQ
jgi:hypothetical protein